MRAEKVCTKSLCSDALAIHRASPPKETERQLDYQVVNEASESVSKWTLHALRYSLAWCCLRACIYLVPWPAGSFLLIRTRASRQVTQATEMAE